MGDGDLSQPKEKTLEEMESECRAMARQVDESVWGQRIREGVARKWTDPEERWFVEHLATKKILPKLVDPALRKGRKDTLESNLARLLVLLGQECKLVPGSIMSIYSDGVDLETLGQLSPREHRAFENLKTPRKVLPKGGYDGKKLSRAYLAIYETSLNDPLAGLCGQDSWEIGKRWRAGFCEKVRNGESLSVARSLGWYDGDVAKAERARKRVNKAVYDAELT